MKDGSAKVSLAEAVQKLPVGQSLITVTDGGKAVMQVRVMSTVMSIVQCVCNKHYFNNWSLSR